jgi:L-lactate transport
MLWKQNYMPVGGMVISTFLAVIPIAVLMYALAVKRLPSWKSSLLGLAAAEVVALFVYRMPPVVSISAAAFGAAFGLFPIGWIVYWAIVLYRITVETGQFAIIKDSIGGLTSDSRLQALLVAFAFGAFIEGACGFGTPVAVAAAMLAGLGFRPFFAASICLLANTSPVAYGAIGIPLVTLSGTTGLPLNVLSANVGRICAPISLLIPSYLVLAMGGWASLKAVFPAAIISGVAFSTTQFFISNFVGPYLTDILASIAAMIALIVLLRFWKPKEIAEISEEASTRARPQYSLKQIVRAWSPYALLVIFVLLWGADSVKAALNSLTFSFRWPALHNLVLRTPPVTPQPTAYGAVFAFNWLAVSGTGCMFAALLSGILLKMTSRRIVRLLFNTGRQLAFPLMTIAVVLALAFLMNYSGATATLGLACAATSLCFPFFSAMLGWLGVFLTGSDTSANALFGSLQVVTANRLGLNAALMAATNSSGGVMGKMISVQSICVAAAATGMEESEEANLFRFTLRHSIFLASLVGIISLMYAYVVPHWVK